jgi:selenocysteine-specific elongation factor
VARPDTLPVTRRVWASVRLLSGSPESLRRGGFVRFHQGTCERAARLRILGEADDGLLRAEIRLRDDTVLLPGDRFILRRPAPVDTVGGGVIEDVRPPEGRARGTTAVLAAGVPDVGVAVLDRLERAGTAGRDVAGLAAELGLPAADLAARLTRLAEGGSVVRTAHGAVLAAIWRATRDRAVAALAAFHRDEPLRTGMSREELRARVARAMSQDTWRDLLEGLQQAGEVRLEGERIALAGHAVRLGGEDEAAAQRLETRFRAAGLDPPDVAEAAAAEPGRGATLLDLLVARGRLVRIRDGRLFHAEALEGLRRRLRAYAETSATIDVATFKEIAGVTRKNAIPLLEHLDAERVTRRAGNVREILGR